MFHPFHMVHVYPKGSLIMEKDFYTIPEAAERCSVGRTTMWRWVKSGKMKANVTLGGQYRILKSDFEATLAENRSHSLSENGNTHPVEVSRNESFRGKTLIVDDDP